MWNLVDLPLPDCGHFHTFLKPSLNTQYKYFSQIYIFFEKTKNYAKFVGDYQFLTLVKALDPGIKARQLFFTIYEIKFDGSSSSITCIPHLMLAWHKILIGGGVMARWPGHAFPRSTRHLSPALPHTGTQSRTTAIFLSRCSFYHVLIQIKEIRIRTRHVIVLEISCVFCHIMIVSIIWLK